MCYVVCFRFIAVAELPDHYDIPAGTIVFDRVIADVYGNTFEPSTGTFTVPRTGVYIFVLDGVLKSGDWTKYLTLRINGATTKELYDGGYDMYHQINGIFAGMLNEGDLVTLYAEVSSPNIRIAPLFHLTFMGMLVV